MRYSASEKREIIRQVAQSHLPTRHILLKLGVLTAPVYRWYDRIIPHGADGLEDRMSGPSRVWSCIPDMVRAQIVDLALEEPELSSRALATSFTDQNQYFVPEASAYRLLKSHDLSSAPASIVVKAADEFRD